MYISLPETPALKTLGVIMAMHIALHSVPGVGLFERLKLGLNEIAFKSI
jgi:hypothetical protein